MTRKIERTLVKVPRRRARSLLGTALHAVEGMLLGPVFWRLAARHGVPGGGMRARSIELGLRAALRPGRRIPASAVFHLLFMPMESTRYFEFDFAWKALGRQRIERYLDVSSPRLFPLSLLREFPGLAADLINPDRGDLEQTQRLAGLIGATHRCRLHDCLIADAPFAPSSFDAVSSLSVIEHIPDDTAAVRRMWELLRPGGTLLLTVPCAARAVEQYIDQDQWGLLEKDREGYVFYQRLYDRQMLEERIFSITGQPGEIAVYGEKFAGALSRNAERKRSDPGYPYWREPYMMANDYRRFDRIEDLPGEGVIGMTFVKPA